MSDNSRWRHGTRYAYNFKKCRCVECRAWNAQESRTKRARRASKK